MIFKCNYNNSIRASHFQSLSKPHFQNIFMLRQTCLFNASSHPNFQIVFVSVIEKKRKTICMQFRYLYIFISSIHVVNYGLTVLQQRSEFLRGIRTGLLGAESWPNSFKLIRRDGSASVCVVPHTVTRLMDFYGGGPGRVHTNVRAWELLKGWWTACGRSCANIGDFQSADLFSQLM